LRKAQKEEESNMRASWRNPIGMMVIVTVLVGLFSGDVADGVTVYFNDADRGPSDILQIGDVTVSRPGSSQTGDQGYGKPATVAGVGLGLDGGMGSSGEWLRQLHFSAGSYAYDRTSEGDLQLDVAGGITSVTVIPVFRVYDSQGNLLPETFGFECGIIWQNSHYSLPVWDYINSNFDGSPITRYSWENDPNGFSRAVFNWGSDMWPVEYDRQDSLSEERTLEYGLRIVSLDYTPAPEPRIATLSIMGLLGFTCLGRKWAKEFAERSMKH
jgi:hypothetical protein